MEAEKNKLVNLLQQKLAEKTAEEEYLLKVCEELRVKRAQIEEEKLKLYEDLVNQMSSYPRGQVTANFLSEETTKRCGTVNHVVEKMEEESEEIVLPEPEDKFTMMAYDDLVQNTEKVVQENSQMEHQLKAMLEESKTASHNADKEYEEIAQQTKDLARYVAEIREEQAKLERELAQSDGNEIENAAAANSEEASPTDLTLAGLERQIREMYDKLEDQLSELM